MGHVFMGNRGKTLALRGDSVTALTWAIIERPRGSIVTNAAMIWTLLCMVAYVDIRPMSISGKLHTYLENRIISVINSRGEVQIIKRQC